MVPGDATDKASCLTLVQDCDALLALHGPVQPNPLQSLFRLLPESDPIHSRSVNYDAVQNLIDAVEAEAKCQRLVRVTGKGEQPSQFFSVLINMLGNMAKGWNYEGEQLLRTSGVEYTIVRPGVMGRPDVPTGKVLALKDDGGDLAVTPVSHSQIADLCVGCLAYPNAARTTLTAMNVEEGRGEETYTPLLAGVVADRREFPVSLLEEHKAAARKGAGVLAVVTTVFLSGVGVVGKAVVGVVVGALS